MDLSELESRISNDISPVVAARELLKERYNADAEAFRQGADVRALVHSRSGTLDTILALIWNRYAFAASADVSLVAVGGYGRGELHPHSDIDLLILTRSGIEENWQEDLGAFITLLWDLKLDIGHSVRSIQESMDAAREDVTILTNLLETRTIAGPDDLRDELSHQVYSDAISSDRDYFIAKREEQKQRHAKYGDTEYNLEPNVKGSPGALRDIQTIGWITKRHFGLQNIADLTRFSILTEEEHQILLQGETFLWRLRFGLQLIADRNENRLLFDHQRALAQMLGYKDEGKRLGVELMMQSYYRTVLALAELTDVILQYYDEAILGAGSDDDILPLNKRFQIRNYYIEAVNNQVFAYAPYAIMEIFVLMAQHPEIKGIRATTIRSLRAHRHLIDDAFRSDLAVTSLFMELLRTPHALDQTLSAMKKYNVLGRYLPEFGQIIGQMQHDLFHIYTVDAHTMRVIRNMVRLDSADARNEYPLASRLIHRLPKLETLYIAGLYHDVAKGRGGDHSELGAIDVEDFCERHHLSERDTQLASWLVENHLLMSMTAQRKDISDPDIIHGFARAVPSQVHLDYLYVLTVCDISATNPKLWNTWRASLLRQLYIETKRALRRGSETPVDRQEWVRATQSEAREILHAQNMTDEQIDGIWETLDEDYFLQDSTVDIAWQTAAIIRHGDDPDPLVLIRDTRGGPTDGYSQIIIYMSDRIDLFAATTAVLEQLNLNIVDARISSSEGPFSISSYIVLDEKGKPLGIDPARKDRVRMRLIEELDDPEDYPDIIHRRTPRQLKHFAFPTEVTFSNDTINQRTVMEVITPDRPGLLARVGQVLLEHRVRLTNAKIATLGERVEDVFFVTDEHGEQISDPAVCQALQQDLCQMLDDTQ
ncbi:MULTISPECIES: [protein-PII] uridylyltransferase [Marinobacter]|uniref:Bifunctional uridylyltransferase/uridylyl-removing enzyme n=2 Tax=Marinobacter TaxID=2742 RepID=W5YT53_9GAMM|nr:MULTISPECIES: [protein-PII] uridylyltransferase [Marinobacter]AHI32316.1 PII uridylyl-transferase [Marinobacter salarius]KXJ45393.1 MAG: [protein-PII] uridylyltransferase [Marinobacter sp. Hex_13]MBS8229463.1 [protein-PII] uridylyltransferase [Marinobacter salarius]WOI18634.1 [protein-PII] uridylyltransferase [Marinobacter salarius]SFL70919.1 UTP--GlnB (protein PII) uridylyltransferase, GlnD [Marinobacter salarius]